VSFEWGSGRGVAAQSALEPIHELGGKKMPTDRPITTKIALENARRTCQKANRYITLESGRPVRAPVAKHTQHKSLNHRWVHCS